MSIKSDGNNIVLNKINTSAALLDYKHSIYIMITFTFTCKESSFFRHSIDHIAHLTILSMSTLIELAVYMNILQFVYTIFLIEVSLSS